MRFCPNCGAQIMDRAKFCTECGTKIEAAVVSAPQSYEPPVQQSYMTTTQVKTTKTTQTSPKKPMMKKVFFVAGGILLLILIGVLLVLFFGGKDQGTEAEWGVYEGISCIVNGENLGAEGEWIELQKKGKAVLCIMEDEFQATWTLEGKKIILKQSGDEFSGTLKDGIIVVDLAGARYTFAKEGALVGSVTYKAISCEMEGESFDEELLAMLGNCFVVFDGDGTGDFYYFGECVPITYDNSNLMVDGDVIPYSIHNGKLKFTFLDGSEFVLKETDEDPEESVPTVFDWDTGEWENADMTVYEEDALSILDWPGQSFTKLATSDSSIDVEGMLGEELISGVVWLETDDDSDTPIVGSVSLYVYEKDYATMCDILTERYGVPTEEGEEPYAESNGGAVQWARFEHPAGVLRLTSGSEQEFLQIMVQKV